MDNLAIIASKEIVYIPIEKISSNPYQPRKVFDRNALNELAQSIIRYGVMQPISVRLLNNKNYELVAGERRLKASKLAGKKTIPAIIVNISDKESSAIALVENLQRENLNFVEEAEGIKNLLNDFCYTQEEVAKILGKNQSTIANKLRILKLDSFILEDILENNLTERHARALLKLMDNKQQREILDKVIKDNLNVKKTEELVEKCLSERNIVDINTQKIKKNIRDLKIFTNTIKAAIKEIEQSGIEIEYSIENDNGYTEINIITRV